MFLLSAASISAQEAFRSLRPLTRDLLQSARCCVMSCHVPSTPDWCPLSSSRTGATDDTTFRLLIRRCKCPSGCDGSSKRDVIWEVWEVFDHNTHIWTFQFGCYRTSNDMPHAVCVCVRERDRELVKWILNNQHQVFTKCSSSPYVDMPNTVNLLSKAYLCSATVLPYSGETKTLVRPCSRNF